MTKFESAVKQISASGERVYEVLTDLRNLEQVKEQLPADKVEITRLEQESIYLKVDLAGEVCLKLIEKEPYKTIKFGADKSPIPFNLWIQLVEKGAQDTRMKLTIKAEIPAMYKMMIAGPVKKFLEMLAEGIANFNFNEINT